jgi:two-component sensor histidine kinase
VGRALSPFEGSEPGRIEVEGPDERVGSRAALALAMAIQELGTNALKHGALSVREGRVRIAWEPDPGGSGALRFSWREGGGPPVRPPERRGFGTTLLEAALGADLDAPRLEYRPEGVRFECGVPFAGNAAAGPDPSPSG